MEDKKIKMENYRDFVKELTSPESGDLEALIARLRELDSQGCDVARLLTASHGIGAEGGEFCEVVKKITFQGKPYNEDNRFHMKREIGDIMWYILQACIALDYDFDEIINENVKKLESRYPGGKFNIHKSENRKSGDL